MGSFDQFVGFRCVGVVDDVLEDGRVVVARRDPSQLDEVREACQQANVVRRVRWTCRQTEATPGESLSVNRQHLYSDPNEIWTAILNNVNNTFLTNRPSLRVGRADVQDSADVISAVSEPAHLVAHQRTQHSIVVRPTAVLWVPF